MLHVVFQTIRRDWLDCVRHNALKTGQARTKEYDDGVFLPYKDQEDDNTWNHFNIYTASLRSTRNTFRLPVVSGCIWWAWQTVSDLGGEKR